MVDVRRVRSAEDVCCCQTLGYLTVVAGFGMAWFMHAGSGAVFAHDAHTAAAPAGAPGTAYGAGRRLLHEEGSDQARIRVREVHQAFAYAILALITLQVCAPPPPLKPLSSKFCLRSEELKNRVA